MKDNQAQLEKLRSDAAECALIRDLAADGAKRDLFDRLATHLACLPIKSKRRCFMEISGARNREK